MKRRYDYFRYKLPSKPAEHYVQQAVPILKELRERFPKQYEECFRCPSEVLTISGVRAFDTYYAFGEKTSEKQLAEIKKFFASKNILLLDGAFPYAGEDNKEKAYALLHLDALHEMDSQYGYITGPTPFAHQLMKSDSDFYMWWTIWKENVAMELIQGRSKLPFSHDKDVLNWWTPHNIAFGMLLGYPGEAICSSYWSEQSSRHFKQVEARIKHADKFDGAWPVYSYDKNLAKNPNIVKHEQLWSDILDKVYAELGL